MDRLMGRLKNNSEIFSFLGVGVLSLLLSNSVLFAQIAPFGIAITAATGGDWTIAAVLGTIIGTLIAPTIQFKMKYIAAVLVIGAVKWAISSTEKLKHHVFLSPLLAAVVLGGTGGAILAASHSETYDFILLVCEILLAGGATFFFARTLTFMNRSDSSPLIRSDASCVIITFGLIVAALCSFQIGDISIGRIAAVVAVLICAYKGAEAGGAVGGVTAGVAVCLCDSSFAFLMGSYGFGGLMAGVFSHFGRFGCAAALIITNGIATALAALLQPTTIAPVVEVFIASILFILIPPSLIKKISLTPGIDQSMSADSVKNIILNRLYFTKKALGEVATITDKVSEKLHKLENPPFDLNAAVADRVCRGCTQCIACWQEGFDSTSSALSDMTSLLRKGKRLSLDDVPMPLRTFCPDPQALIDSLTSACDEQRRQETGFARNVQLRSIVLDQWSGIEQMIGDISSDINRIAVQNEQTGARIREYLSRRTISVRTLSCYEDESGHILIEISVTPGMYHNLDKTELSFDFSEICDRDFSLPTITEQEGGILLVFHERARFKLTCGVTQVCSTGKRLCGDSFKFIEETGGTAMVILSDGMGNGSLAAIDSSMATSLIGRLVSAGVGLEATLKLVNSAMLIKSGDESLATVDICRADLYRGSITLYKAGAAPSYIRKGGKVGFVESSSLPAGILNSVEFQETTLSLDAGDIVLMISDGVTQIGEDWVLDELDRFEGDDMQWLCERISSLAKLRRNELHDDDITVFALMMHDAV